MRPILILAIPLLLAGCDKPQPPEAQPPQAQPAAPPPPAEAPQPAALAVQGVPDPDPDNPPPLCGDAKDEVVRIEISTAGVASPDRCTVGIGTIVYWWQPAEVAFDADFTEGIPDVDGQKHFKSKKNKKLRWAGFRTKHIDGTQQIEYPYNVTANGVTADPTVIIDPNKNK